jgi:hypothetical protein
LTERCRPARAIVLATDCPAFLPRPFLLSSSL